MTTAGLIASPLPHGAERSSEASSISSYRERLRGLRLRGGRRKAFTLVELLVVIAIIAILAAILSVTVVSVITYINSFTISMEITKLEQALTAYSSEYGSYPPCIGTVPAANANANAFYRNQFNRHIVTAFRNSREQASDNVPLRASDATTPITANATLLNLDASETLPYFLGGAAVYSNNEIGLKKDPVRPLTGSVASEAVSFYTFEPEQLVDLDGDGFPSYIPKAANDGSTPFVYFNGPSYRDQAAAFSDRMPDLCWPPQFVAAGDPGSYQDWIDGTPPVASPGLLSGYDPGIVRPYINGRVAPPASEFYNVDTYQLISAGLDNDYGADAADPDFAKAFADGTDPTEFKFLAPTDGAVPWVNMHPDDEDNVANFTAGQTFGDVGLE